MNLRFSFVVTFYELLNGHFLYKYLSSKPVLRNTVYLGYLVYFLCKAGDGLATNEKYDHILVIKTALHSNSDLYMFNVMINKVHSTSVS